MKPYSPAHLARILESQGKPVDFTIPKERKPRKNDESREQQALIRWWASAHAGFGVPEVCLFAIPNGGWRGVVTGSIMKREGVRSGVSDLFLAVPRKGVAGAFIEMKHATGRVSPDQDLFINAMRLQGYYAETCFGFEHAKKSISSYISP